MLDIGHGYISFCQKGYRIWIYIQKLPLWPDPYPYPKIHLTSLLDGLGRKWLTLAAKQCPLFCSLCCQCQPKSTIFCPIQDSQRQVLHLMFTTYKTAQAVVALFVPWPVHSIEPVKRLILAFRKIMIVLQHNLICHLLINVQFVFSFFAFARGYIILAL